MSPTLLRPALLAMFAVLVLVKIPSVLAGRLWAEDGFFLWDAIHLPWWQALFAPHTGYIDFTASAALLLATRISDLTNVGIASVALAWIIQVCPAIILLTSRCQWLQSPWSLSTALLLILLPPMTEEVWLSPVTSQYHLMVCVACVLAFEPATRRAFWFQCVVLAIAGLTGPGPSLATPLFLLRAMIERSWQRVLQATILTVGTLIEIRTLLLYYEPTRHLEIGPILLGKIIYLKHVTLPFFGSYATNMLFALAPLLVLLLFVGLVGAVIKARGHEVRWLFATCVIMMVLSYVGSLGPKEDLLNLLSGQRYYYAPQVLLGLTLLGIACTGRPIVIRRLVVCLIPWMLLVGGWQYRQVNPAMAKGPSWSEQIEQWRTDPSKPIMVWPPSIRIRL